MNKIKIFLEGGKIIKFGWFIQIDYIFIYFLIWVIRVERGKFWKETKAIQKEESKVLKILLRILDGRLGKEEEKVFRKEYVDTGKVKSMFNINVDFKEIK